MTTTYVAFDPPRRAEQYVGQSGPHNGLALEHNVLEAIGQARAFNRTHPYVVRGEWRRDDGVAYLDIAVDIAWLTANSHYQLVEGRLRWVCPICGRMSGTHTKACDYE